MSVRTVPASEWHWDGHPGHFIAAYHCHFWLNTRIGNYRVSTIGDYQPHERGVNETIGVGRTHETFVFETDDAGEVSVYSEIDTDAYTDCAAATAGHLAMCRKYAQVVVQGVST